jgi:hypothetical protein
MAVIFMCGFEAQSISTDTNGGTITGTASYSTAIKRTGAASFRCNPASAASGYGAIIFTTTYEGFGLYVASLPSVTRLIRGTGGAATLKLNSIGQIVVFNAAGTSIGTSTTALSTGAWHWIGVRWGAFTGVCLQINGVNEVSGTQTGTPSDLFGCSGTESTAIDIYFDDIITNDTDFLGPSKVDIALPISDNTRTAVVTGDGAGTTNLWDAVNNTPPTGVASASETATTNIEYPASTTEDYIANLETYTTLGLVPTDSIIAVQSAIRHGEDIAVGTKTMQNVGALTNPTYAGVSTVTFGLDGGAHGADVGGFWAMHFGTVQQNPSVTLGTSPTIRASRTSETRVGCIDFMGMLVAWTPGRVPYSTPYPPLLAQ